MSRANSLKLALTIADATVRNLESENQTLRERVERLEAGGGDGLRTLHGAGKPLRCRVLVTCSQPVVMVRSDDEMGATPYCAEHDRPDMPESSLMQALSTTPKKEE